MEGVKKILVPIDFSDCSEEALGYAVFLAEQLKATVLVAHVMELMVYPIDFTLADHLAYPNLKKEVSEELERIVDPWRGKGVPIETHLLKGDSSEEIVSAAKDLSCDLIIMGTHGRKGFSRALMGSVTEQVVRTSFIPVLTVRKQDGHPQSQSASCVSGSTAESTA